MFDIGFAELLIIGIVALLVVGPEKLPGTIRTASLYLNRIRRGFNEIKREVQQELHNDAVMSELRNTGEELKRETQGLGQDIKEGVEKIASSASIDAESESEAAQRDLHATDTNTDSPRQEKPE